MRTTGIAAALLLGLSLILAGNVRGDELGESYFPLKADMRWEYSVSTDKGDTKKLIITNLAPKEMNQKTVTPRRWEIGGTTFFQLMEKDDSGIYRYAEQDAENAPPVLVTPRECHLRFPITQGNSWKMTTKMGDSPLSITLTIESVSDEVTVPAGTFKDCLKIKQAGENEAGVSVLAYEWYAPKVGVVKSMVAIKKKGKEGEVSEHRVYQLVSFKP